MQLFRKQCNHTNTAGTGYTATGRVLSYDNKTGVLKYWQDRSVSGFDTGTYQLVDGEIYSQTRRFYTDPMI